MMMSGAAKYSIPSPMTGVLFPQGGSPATHHRSAPSARLYAIKRWFG
jgi:hypothetical protein